MAEKDERTKHTKKEQTFLDEIVPGYLKKSHDTLPSPPPPPDEELFESDRPPDSDPPKSENQHPDD